MGQRRHPQLRVCSVLIAGTLLVVVATQWPAGGTEPLLRTYTVPHPTAALGVFLGSDAQGVERIPDFEQWLGREVTVGRTYLPGDTWSALRGPDFILEPWSAWRAAKPDRVLAINVPMVVPNEGGLSDTEVSARLRAGATGAYDLTFRHLADRLVATGASDSILSLGWEMNGTTYSSRCAPDPAAWKEYWRRIVTTMRSVPGQHFRFDFTANRGVDAIPWSDCYPGDDVVDIIGLDSYDQPPSGTFAGYISEPYGLQYHADFAAAHGKQLSFPEWGLFRNGDRPKYVRDMLEWIDSHNVAYQSITDYCPHGVWECTDNPQSSLAYRRELKLNDPTPTPSVPSAPPIKPPADVSTTPTVPTPTPTPTPTEPTPTVSTPIASTPAGPTPAVPTPSVKVPRVSVPRVRWTKAWAPAATPSAPAQQLPTPAPAPADLQRPSPTTLPPPSTTATKGGAYR
ncbi:glycoside hydrolase family 26 protein [Nonomuraea sediminis]|uniref:glycoside hydrolase family 26 protein n=1 Tax=Nonomuraea sediminis TaxID=2835864 RepID=UPI001BDC6374|nr:glycosyl hydrolase [Nonomuraea sediminis]